MSPSSNSSVNAFCTVYHLGSLRNTNQWLWLTLADSCPAIPLLRGSLPSPLSNPWGPNPLPSLPSRTRSCGRLLPLPLARHKATDAAVTDGASRPAPQPAATLRDAQVSRPIPSRPRSQGRLGPRAGVLVLRVRPRPGAAEGLRSVGLSRSGGGTRWDSGVLAPPSAPRARAGTQGFMSLCAVAAAVGG